MVRAGSIQHIQRKKKLKTIFIVLVVVALLIFSVVSIFVKTGGKSSIKEAKVSDETRNNISSLNFNASQPAKLPEGFKRTVVKIIPESQTDTGCQELFQSFTKTKNENINYIDIYVYSSECAYPRPDDADAFSIGDYAGWLSDSNKNLSYLYEITVLQAMVRIETDLSPDQMKEVLSKFVKFKA